MGTGDNTNEDPSVISVDSSDSYIFPMVSDVGKHNKTILYGSCFPDDHTPKPTTECQMKCPWKVNSTATNSNVGKEKMDNLVL